MRQGNILNEATAVSLVTFLGEAIRLVIQIVALHSRFLRSTPDPGRSSARSQPKYF